MKSVFSNPDSELIEFSDADGGAVTDPRPASPAALRRLLARFALPAPPRGVAPERLEEMLRLTQELSDASRSKGDLPGLAHSLGNQALILQSRGDLDGALSLHQEKEALCRRLNDAHGLATALANQARILASERDRPADALPLAEQALAVAERHGLTALAGQTRPILDDIRQRLGDGA